MPVYEYQCLKCETIKEIKKSFAEFEREESCDNCNSPLQLKVSRSSFQLKGAGWYKTDYPKASK